MWHARQALAKIRFHLASSCSHLWCSCPPAVCNHAMAGQGTSRMEHAGHPITLFSMSLIALLKLPPTAVQTYPQTLPWGISGWPSCSSDAGPGATWSPRRVQVKSWRELVLTFLFAFRGHARWVCSILGSDHRTLCTACGTAMPPLPEFCHQLWFNTSCLASRMPPSTGFLTSELSRWLEIMYKQ